MNLAEGNNSTNNTLSSRCLLVPTPTPTPLVVSNDVSAILELLPPEMVQDLSDARIQETLSDIVIDVGRQATAWAAGKRINIGDNDKLVSSEDIASIVDKVGDFGPDNRACLHGHLHRISAVRNRQRDIIGLTMRVGTYDRRDQMISSLHTSYTFHFYCFAPGRHVTGTAAMISDLLFADPTKSILFLGPPGSGKVGTLAAGW